MSRRLGILNWILRKVEKPALARNPPARLRRDLEIKSRLWFHPPRGSQFRAERIGGVAAQWAERDGARARDAARVMLYLHGGGYVFGSSRTHRAMMAQLVRRTGLAACLPDYRLAPEHAFPAQIEDALACYRDLSARHEVVIGGDSAGGGLALALLHEIRAQGLAAPAGVFAFSPLADFTFSGGTIRSNAERDVLLSSHRVAELSDMVLPGGDPKDPRISPLFGDYAGAPPVWIAAGDTEILLDDSRRLDERLRAQGVDVTLTVAPDHPHVWTLFHAVLPEARGTLDELGAWIRALG